MLNKYIKTENLPSNYSPIEVTFNGSDDFLKIRETLSRMGIASKNDNTLYQTAHILHKQGKYFIVHFKELFALDGKKTDISEDDIARRNTIADLLQQWGLLKIVDNNTIVDRLNMSYVKVIPHSEKNEWKLVAKYSIGGKRKYNKESV